MTGSLINTLVHQLRTPFIPKYKHNLFYYGVDFKYDLFVFYFHKNIE